MTDTKTNTLFNEVNKGKEYDRKFPFGKPFSYNTIIPLLIGKDDASVAYYVPIPKILDGTIPLAFAHAAHLVSTYTELSDRYPENDFLKTCIEKLILILQLSLERNKRLMCKINDRLAEINESLPVNKHKTLHHFSPIDDEGLQKLRNDCEINSILIDKYFDETNDSAEVTGCTNDFNLNQVDEPGRASDAIRIIIDSNGEHWIILIVRAFAPGIGNLALAGGFLDSITESHSKAADRELDEEVDGLNWLKSSYNIKFDLPEQKIPEWDIRAKFAKHGMIVGGNAIIYLLDSLNDNKLKTNCPSKCCIIA